MFRKFLIATTCQNGSIRAVQTCFRWLTNLFPLWSVLVAVVALAWPGAFDWYSGTMIRVGLGIIMLGMGLTLTLDDFRRVFVIPLALLAAWLFNSQGCRSWVGASVT